MKKIKNRPNILNNAKSAMIPRKKREKIRIKRVGIISKFIEYILWLKILVENDLC